MSTQSSQAVAAAAPQASGAGTRVLRRKCECGTHTIGGGECEECNNKRTLRRRTTRATERGAEHGDVPQVVHEVLRSPGKSLDAGVRALLEPRFGHDFSRVRVHTDAKASESAAAVSAVAYTVGRDIVFAGGQYAPHTSEGRSLLAHELTHVAQNANATTDTSAPIRVGPAGDRFESEADRHAEAAAVGAPTHGSVSPQGEPGRLSRATLQFGTTKVEIDYGNVVKKTSSQFELEIESMFTSWTGSAASTIHTELTALSNAAKEWVLFALDLLVDNPVAGLDKVAAVRRLIAYAPTARIRPLGNKQLSDFPNEALSVSGWFEKALTSGITDLKGVRLNYVQGYLKQSSGGAACPARTQPGTQFNSRKLESDLPTELTTYLGKVVVPTANVKTQAMSPLLKIADAVQAQARAFYAPYADKGRGDGNTFVQQWQYSAHAVSSQSPAGTPHTDLRLAYLDSRARIVGDKGLFSQTNFDPRCSGDEAVLAGIVQKMEQQAGVRALVDPILRQKSYTEESATPKQVVINPQYDSSKSDECDARWKTIRTMCHELMHVMEHDDFRAAIRGRMVLREGFPEVLGHYLYEHIAAQPALKSTMEDGLQSAPCQTVPSSTIGYGTDGPDAEKIRVAVKNDAFRAAFFLGQLAKAGIQPKRIDGKGSSDPHEAEADSASRAVAESRTVNPSFRPAPSFPSLEHVNAGTGQPLEPGVRREMESRFGHDFSGVRIHTDARAHESARAFNALAYTVGRDIAFGAGQYAPGTPAGRRLLAHELTHTIQQGSAAPANVGGLGLSRPEDSAETEAEVLADKVLSGGGVHRPVERTAARVARQPTPKSGAPTPKEAAVKAHVAQQDRVARMIKDGLRPVPPAPTDTRDIATLFHNSCQWIESGRAVLTILSRTHDATTRRPGFIAHFDRLVKYPATGGDYAETPAAGDDDHISYVPPRELGGMQADEFTLIDPARQNDDELKSTFVHEAQHSADQTFWGRKPQPPPGRVEGSPGLTGGNALVSAGFYNNYQSEFRAYFIGTREGSAQDALGSSTSPATNTRRVTWTNPRGRTFTLSTSFKNERQEKIFWHILNNYPALEVAQTYTQDVAYRNMVNTFAQPAGINLVNSVRIQELSDALKSCKPSMDESAPEVQSMLRKAGALDLTDRAFLNEPSGSERFWAQARGALSSKMFGELQAKVDPTRAVPRPVPPQPKFGPLYKPRTDFNDRLIRDVEGL